MLNPTGFENLSGLLLDTHKKTSGKKPEAMFYCALI